MHFPCMGLCSVAYPHHFPPPSAHLPPPPPSPPTPKRTAAPYPPAPASAYTLGPHNLTVRARAVLAGLGLSTPSSVPASVSWTYSVVPAATFIDVVPVSQGGVVQTLVSGPLVAVLSNCPVEVPELSTTPEGASLPQTNVTVAVALPEPPMPGHLVRVTCSPALGSAVSVAPASVVFSASTFSVAQTFTVTPRRGSVSWGPGGGAGRGGGEVARGDGTCRLPRGLGEPSVCATRPG